MRSGIRMLAAALAAGLAAGWPAAATADQWDDLVGAEGLKKIAGASPGAAARPDQPRKVLVLTEAKADFDAAAKNAGMKFVPHASAPHCAKAVAILGARTGAYEATITSDCGVLSAEGLKGYDAVVLANVYLEGKCYKVPRDLKDADKPIFEARRKALLAFVADGKGLVGIHNAACEALGWPEYNRMIGGTHRGLAWYAHQAVPVKLDDPASPINAAFGGKPFEVRDDIYQFAGPYSRDACHVLLSVDAAKAPAGMTADRPDRDYPVSWVKACGKGRVFYTALGDSPATFADAALLAHLLAGIRFALGDLAADTSPGKCLPAEKGFTPMPGWQVLFDGRNLDAWRASDQHKQSWVVDDGIIRYDGKAGTLQTKESFKDYVLRVDFRLPRKADSGVFVRDSMQLNIWTWDMGSGEMWEHRRGAATGPYVPTSREDRAVGDWNTFLVTVKDDRVTVVLNGKEVISGAELKAKSKAGPIGLQRHGDPIEYKSIYIKPLTTEATKPPANEHPAK